MKIFILPSLEGAARFLRTIDIKTRVSVLQISCDNTIFIIRYVTHYANWYCYLKQKK